MTGVAKSVVHARLAEQVAAARAHEEGVGRDEAHSVHQMRVALRRLRSALVTFRPLLDRNVTEPLREEIKWFAGMLGAVRDTDVMQELLGDLVASEPTDPGTEPVGHHLDEQLDRERSTANQQLDEAMASPRYQALMASLDVLADSPPWASDPKGEGGRLLRARIRRDFKRVRQSVDEVHDAPTQDERDERLHEVRKAAKRARYAAESVETRYGEDARVFAEAMETIQTILGDQHDAVIALDRLRDAATHAQAAGQDTFALGRLHARTAQKAQDLVAEFEKSWQDAKRKSLRRWL